MAKPLWIFPLLAALWSFAYGYLIVLPSDTSIGTIVFEAGVPQLGGRRRYEVSNERTAWFAQKLLKVHQHTGRVTLARSLSCEGLHYPRIFTLYVDSTSSRLGRATIDYYSLPLRIIISGCGHENQDLAFAMDWTAETLASFAMPSTDKFTEICLKASQLVASLRDFLPQTVTRECEIKWSGVVDPRFLIEGAAGDLVSAAEQCLVDPLWKVSVSMLLRCGAESRLADVEHRLKIVFHHRQLDDTDLGRRVRRELKNQSPYFEQPLYVAAVEEEQEPGVLVTMVRARDPEGGAVRYLMSSLLDARSQTLLSLDPSTGRVTTRSRLDRESIDVHYFQVLAVDDSFPPRTGTTTLQVNVMDANDHSPNFEWPGYETSVREGVPVGSTVIAVKASDQDTGRNAEVEYTIVSTTGAGVDAHETSEESSTFRIDPRTGIVTTRLPLDREKIQVYTVVLCVTDLATPPSERKSTNATLVIRVLDDNDNYPQFSERTYAVSVPEDLDYTSNPIIARIRATDIDSGNNAAIRYAIIGGNTQNTFSIDSMSGDVALVKPLDYETTRTFRIVIRAQDGGLPARSNPTHLLVHVKDVNDNSPRFYTSHFQEAISESIPVETSIVRVQAYDADEGTNAQIMYNIAPRDTNGGSTDNFPIAINPETGWIYTTKLLDREQCSKYQFTVIASDSGDPPRSASVTVVLTVTDVNDNDPSFESKNYEAVVSEDDSPGTPVTSVTASDPDEDATIRYEITAGNTRGRFAISSQNGRGLVTIAQPLDYKQEKRFVLTVTASDNGGRTDTALINVNISDANNFSPVFENAPYSVSVFEDAPIGTTVLVVSATDSDVGQNAQVTYSLGTDTGEIQEASEFTINPQTGAITTTRNLDREQIPGYVLTVTAKDGGIPPLSDTTDVEISVTDINDNSPTFEAPQYQGSIPEDVLVGTSVLTVSATDADVGLNGRLRYTLEDDGNGAFSVDPTTGILRTAKSLDRESVARYALRAAAVDRGSPSLSSVVPIIIKIEDINDSPPAFENDKIMMYITENSPIGSTVGEIYAHDPDDGPNAIVQYSIIGGEDANAFALNTRSGSDRAELVTLEELDYESPKKRFELVIRASSPPLRSDALLHVMVTDVNDNAPVLKDFQVIFNNFKDFFPTVPIGKIPAVDADVTDKLIYTIISGNNANLIELNTTTGEIKLSPQLNTNVPRVATMEVGVTDGLNEAKATMTLSVRLITDQMLLNSITVRLEDMTVEAFLSPLMGYFIDGLAAIIPCPRENIFLFSVQDDTVVNGKILNVSFSARKFAPGKTDEFYSPQYLQERVYLNRGILARLATVTVLPFDDNLCVREPCFNFEECITVLKFGNASGFASSSTVLFRPIYPVTTFACVCAKGFTGSREAYLCDTEVNLCYSNPCTNDGTCHRREGGYTCSCGPNFTGPNCEIALDNTTGCHQGICKGGSQCSWKKSSSSFICEGCPYNSRAIENVTPLCELRARSFEASTFLTFPSLKQRHRLHIKLKFSTESNDGLLLYNGRYNEQHDFIALEIIDSRVHFSFSLGDEITRTSAGIPGGVSDGQWHEVQVSYINKSVVISLDDCDIALALEYGEKLGPKWACAGRNEQILEPRCGLVTETCHRFLDLTGPLQIGGLPAIPSSFQIRNTNFVGCIKDLNVDHSFVDLNAFVADNGTNVGCPEKASFCSSAPCKNDGSCKEIWSGFVCECQEGYAGLTCTEEIGKPWHFHGDGMLSFNPLLRPIQLPWLTALSLRTRSRQALVMSVQIGQNSSVTFEIQDDRLVAFIDGVDIIRSRNNVNDGEWHRIEVIWQTGQVSMYMDYRTKPNSAPLTAKLQGLYVGRILLGGPDHQSVALRSSSFDGCLQNVRIGANQSALQTPTVEENVSIGCIHPDTEIACNADCPEASICIPKWQSSECVCAAGRVGQSCERVCDLNPCNDTGICIENSNDRRGYKCNCKSAEYSGDYCEIKADQPCPATWWGSPVCGPCHCDEAGGYDSSCNKTTGECYCKENHYQPAGKEECIPCECYITGSYGPRCDVETGQCRCRTGVIGRSCTECPNPYAEVTLRGCEVVYDGCPRSYAQGLWWPRTKFGYFAIEDCPGTAEGKGSRSCDDKLGGWQPPDLFNCTSEQFIELRYQLAALEAKELTLNTYVAVKMAKDLHLAANSTKDMYGADLLVAETLLEGLLRYEESLAGLNLTHSQDKDYVSHIIGTASAILRLDNADNWERLEKLNKDSPGKILNAMARYLNILISSQHDTYTDPFEVAHSNVVLGLDIVTPESLYGFEPVPYTEDPSASTSRPAEADQKVVLPDTSAFLLTPKYFGPSISFPKYNNYIADPNRFDPYSKVQVPLKILGIKPVAQGELNFRNSLNPHKAIFSYVQYRQLGSLLPKRFDDSVAVRWGVEVSVGSPVITVSVSIPSNTNGYESLTGTTLETPVQVNLWINEHDDFKTRINPQCVHWSTVRRGIGEWSRLGCTTEVDSNTILSVGSIINCSCLQLSTYAVLTDVLDLEYVPEPSLLEDVTSYSAFLIALPLLLSALLILALIRGGGTNSNSIHKNLVCCVFLAESLFLIALKARTSLVANEFLCKLTAIVMHYVWLSIFSWTLVDSVHLHRMLTEMRDVNHGPMRFYYTMGYGMPAIIVGLAIGVRADQYGNFYFCWLSIYETVIWSLIGPVLLAVIINFCILVMCVRAAFTLKEHIMGFGNLRTLLWLSIASLPLLGSVWTLSVLNASENSPTLSYLLSTAIVIHATFCLIGYCFVNSRVRRNLYLSLLKCLGKKRPLLEGSMANGSSSQNVTGQTRSALTYASTYSEAACRRVHVGVSTSSTTSRSTNKTGSSPYRSDLHLRHTSTSTSNYNSDRDPYTSSRSHRSAINSRQETCDDTRGPRRDSESDSDGSRVEEDAARGGLDLASSHSSDEDDTTLRSHKNIGVSTQQSIVTRNYLPSIHDNSTEHLDIICSNTDLFPNLKPIYAPRWSSQLPEAYHLTPNVLDIRGSNWSANTVSDNEIGSNKTSSPNPLPYPDINSPQQTSPPDENYSETEEKVHHLGEKYLFPYTAEEDHTVSPTPYTLSMSSRILASSMSHHSQASNHENYSGSDKYGSLKRIGQGSQHDEISNSDIYGHMKGHKIPPMMDNNQPEYILPMSGRILASSLTHDLQHSNELTALTLPRQRYNEELDETEKNNAETSV